MARLMAYFYVYSFVGWLYELLINPLTTGRFYYSSLEGPWTPIYGIGMVAVIYLLKPLYDRPWLYLAGTVLITSMAELFSGCLLELLFHFKWWDYSSKVWAPAGYIAPLYSLIFGVGAFLIARYLHPLVSRQVERIPHTVLVGLMIFLSLLLAVDTVAAVVSILRIHPIFQRSGQA